MPKSVPTPVAAAIGLGPTALLEAKKLALELPVRAFGATYRSLGATRRAYRACAETGEDLIGRLSGASLDVFEDGIEDAAGKRGLGGAYERVEDSFEDGVEHGRRLSGVLVRRARRNASEAMGVAGRALDETGETAEALVAADEVPEAEQGKGEPTPSATQPDITRAETAASPDVVEVVEAAASEHGEEEVSHDDLPLADYDHMTLGSLRGRLRALEVEDLVTIRTYEKTHAKRLPVMTMLDNRIAKLAVGDATPTGNVTDEPAPEQRYSARGKSKVTPATGGPAQNPPSQGVPTNPAQPRTAGPGTNPDSAS